MELRRPIIPITLAMSIGMTFAYYENKNTKFILAVIFIGMAAFLIFNFQNWKKKRLKYITKTIAFVMITFFLGIILMQIDQEKLECQRAKQLQENCFAGLITQIQKSSEDYFKLTVQTTEGKIMVFINESLEDYKCLVGLKGQFIGKVEIPDAAKNPHCFNYKQYLETKGITCIMKADTFVIEDNGEGPFLLISLSKAKRQHVFAIWKNRFSILLEEYVGEEISGFLSGMLFGDTDELSEDTAEQFRKNGTAHILAVSGLHMGIVYGFLDKILGKKRRKREFIIKGLFILLYTGISGFSPSTIRATVMIFLHMISKVGYWRYDMLSALCVCAIGNLIINPMELFNLGFQLSYIAIFTMSIVVARFKKHRGLLLPAFLLQLGISPIIAYYFNCFSKISILLNIPVLYLAGIIVPLGIILLFLIPIMSFMETFKIAVLLKLGTTKLLAALCTVLIKINELAYFGGNSFWYCKSPKLWMLVLYYGFLFFLMSEYGFICIKRRQIPKLLMSIGFVIILSILTFAISYTPFDKANLIFVDVGQGDCLHIRTEDGKNVLIDGGGSAFSDVGKKTLLPYILKNGANHIDLAIVTHLHLDHYEGLRSLSELITINEIAISSAYSEAEFRECFPNYKGRLIFLDEGEVVKLSKNTNIEVFSTGRKSENENDKSLILKVTTMGISALMTADIDSEGEMTVVNNAKKQQKSLECDILKVAHHGSRYSSGSKFIEETRPKIAVIQVGKNVYGHPSEDTLNTLKNAGISTFRNDEKGAVGIYIEKEKKVRILVMK